MKQQILTYKSDGNGLKTINQELTRVLDHVYYYSNEDEFYPEFHIIFEWNGIYFFVQSYSDENRVKGITSEMYNNWIEQNLSDGAVLNPDRYTRNLEVEVLRLSGATPEFLEQVMKNKAAHMKRREEASRVERDEYTRKELERKEASTKKELEQLLESEKDYKEGKRITPDVFIKLCDKYGVKIPIATKGRLLNEGKTGDVSNYGYCQPKTYKGKLLRHFSGYFKVMKELNEKLGA